MGKGFFEKIGLMKSEDEISTKETKKPAPSFKSQPAITPINTSSSFDNVGGSAQAKYIDYFKKVFAERNFPGPDYQELVNGIDTLKSVGMAENMKFVSVFAGLAAQGLTKAKLIDTAKKYIGFFDEKKKGFEGTWDGKYADEVTKRQQDITNIKTDNTNIQKQIDGLVAKMNDNNKSSEAIAEEVRNAQFNLQKEKSDFDASYQAMVNEINENITKIETHIPDAVKA